MNGTFEVNDPLPEVMEFIRTFNPPPPPNITPLNQEITTQKFKKAFSKLHEKKASSASGRHIGHYKAATHSDTLSKTHSTMMNIAFKFGTAPTRWSTVIDIVISKEGATPRQHRTRIIQKLEADANQILLIAFTKPITHQIDKHNIHHTSQYADHQQQCTSAVLYKDLQCEYARINKTSLAWMETDCTGCYDRMNPNTLLMNAQTMGASRNSCIALGKVWKNLKHHVQTGHGTSIEHYPKLKSTYQGGAGQGSAYATLCWKGISYQIYGLLDKMDKATVTHPITNTHSSSNTAGYVDDLSMVFTPTEKETTHQNTTLITQSLSHMMERTGQKYEKLLHVAGGDLNLPKGHCYILTWHWNEDGTATAHTIAQTPINTRLTHGRNNTKVNIPRKETHEPCKTLGCHTAPNGSHKGQFKALMTKAIQFGAAARHRGTTKNEAYMKHRAYFCTGITFPLGVSNIPHKDLRTIERKFLKPTNQQMGFRCTTSNSIIHAPKDYLGIGLPSITTTSDLLHFRMLCGHIRENGTISNTLLATMGSLQMQSGLTKPIFHSPKEYSSWCEK
jgi:hypothetical protein